MADDERGGTTAGTGHRVTVAPAAGPRPADHDREPVVSRRGLLLVGAAVLLGVFILPAATRAPLRPTSATSAPPPAASAGTTTAGAGSTPSAGSSSSGVPSSSTTTAPAGPAPSSVHVLVANGSTVNGLGALVSRGLAAKGYAMLPPVVALTTLSSTEVWTLTPTGNAAVAEVLAALGIPASAVVGPQGGPAPVSAGSGADLVVVAGPDVASRFPPPSSSAG
jgi:hypothetical protein